MLLLLLLMLYPFSWVVVVVAFSFPTLPCFKTKPNLLAGQHHFRRSMHNVCIKSQVCAEFPASTALGCSSSNSNNNNNNDDDDDQSIKEETTSSNNNKKKEGKDKDMNNINININKQEERQVLDPKFLQRNKCWVILVDDEESIRMSVGDFLYDEGYQVTACDGADSLLQVLENCNNSNNSNSNNNMNNLPSVIVSDVRMPGTDGIQLLELLRRDIRYQRIPVVMLTAKALTADRIAGFQAGADAYLPKPFYPQELLSILDNAILRRQQVKNSQSSLASLKEEMTTIKSILKMQQQNSATFVTPKKTRVYLTPAERDVLELVCQGLTNKEIAQRRGVSLDRIIKVIQKLFRETQTNNRTELVRWAFETGYASPL